MVYISHGWFLGYNNSPLISEAVEAWKYGPVIKKVYDEVKSYGKDQITAYFDINEDGEITREEYLTENPKINQFLELIWSHYKQYDGFQLSDLTHRVGSPWDRTVKKFGVNHIIPNSFIGDYYYNLIENNDSGK